MDTGPQVTFPPRVHQQMRGAGEEGFFFETVAAFDVRQEFAPVGGQPASSTVTLPREQSDSELSRFDKLSVMPTFFSHFYQLIVNKCLIAKTVIPLLSCKFAV